MKSRVRHPLPIILGLFLFIGGIYAGYRVLFPDVPLVGIILWTKEIRGFEDSFQGVIEGLREEGYKEGLNIRLAVRNARGDRNQAAAAVREIIKRGARLLITVGTVPTLVALEITQGSKIPIVYTTVGFPDATGLCRPASPAAVRFTGTSMEVPVGEQLRFLLMARPGFKRLGILYCDATPQAVATGKEAIGAAPKLGLTPLWRTVADDRSETLLRAVNELLAENIEALFVPTDPVLSRPKNLEIICQATSQACIPVMVPDGNSVGYGPLLSYHCDFVEIGHQSGRQAAQLLNGVPLSRIPPESPHIKKLTINLKVAQELGLQLPRQLISQAYRVYQ